MKIPRKVASRDELALIVGRSLRTIGTWLGRGMPGKDGHYDVGDCVKWAFLEGLLKFERTTDIPEDETPHDRLERLKGDEKEIELARLRETILDRDPTERWWTLVVYEIKALLDQLADRLAAEMPTGIPPELRQKVRNITLAVLTDVYSVLAQTMDDVDESVE